MLILEKLPFSLRTNIADVVYSGPVALSFHYEALNDENTKPFIASSMIWFRAANAQFFTCGRDSTRIDMASLEPSPERNTLTLRMNCSNVEPAAWVSLFCQIAQVAQHFSLMHTVAISLNRLPAEAGSKAWGDSAARALFSVSNMPESFKGVYEFLLPGNPIDIDIDFERDLTAEEFSDVQKELEVWGCLLATGGLRLDLEPVEEPLHAFSFGATTQLTPSWIRYSKQEFDGPVESIALLDHWIGGLRRKGLMPSSIEIS